MFGVLMYWFEQTQLLAEADREKESDLLAQGMHNHEGIVYVDVLIMSFLYFE